LSTQDNSRSHNSVVNYPILSVNAGIIGSIFIFFALASQVPASTIFALDTKKCSFIFNLLTQHAQIAVAMVGGILILPFSISSVLALVGSSKEATMAASIGFALMFVAAITILSSLSCRIPTGFFIEMIVIPSVITAAIIVGVHMYSERKRIRYKT
jgi:hypothetical protein